MLVVQKVDQEAAIIFKGRQRVPILLRKKETQRSFMGCARSLRACKLGSLLIFYSSNSVVIPKPGNYQGIVFLPFANQIIIYHYIAKNNFSQATLHLSLYQIHIETYPFQCELEVELFVFLSFFQHYSCSALCFSLMGMFHFLIFILKNIVLETIQIFILNTELIIV